LSIDFLGAYLLFRKSFSIELNVRIMRSFWSEAEEIWENGEPSHFPHNPC